MPKASKIKLKYHVKAGEEAKKTHKHVDYSIGADGKVSTARSTIRTSDKVGQANEKLTTEAQEDKREEEVWEWGEGVDSNEAVDQAYLEHIEEIAIDEKDKAARVRPKGVRLCISPVIAISA